MDKHGEGVIFGTYDGHVVLELGGIHFATPASNHFDDIVLQSLKVHIDVVHYSIEGSRAGPKAAAASSINGLHHRVGVEHREFVANLVAVIPLLQFVEVHGILCDK